MQSPFSLKNGTLYAAAIKLSSLEKAFASIDLITNKFTTAGFSGVTVTPDKTRVEGTWAQADADNVSLPSQVTQVWSWQEDDVSPVPITGG